MLSLHAPWGIPDISKLGLLLLYTSTLEIHAKVKLLILKYRDLGCDLSHGSALTKNVSEDAY